MKWFIPLVLGVSVAAVAHLTRPAAAADTKATTVVTISGLHCAGCAKKVAKKLESITHVASAAVDPKSGQATITPAKDKRVSPKAMWEAVETAGYKPTKLVGPDGEFTKKPKA